MDKGAFSQNTRPRVANQTAPKKKTKREKGWGMGDGSSLLWGRQSKCGKTAVSQDTNGGRKRGATLT